MAVFVAPSCQSHVTRKERPDSSFTLKCFFLFQWLYIGWMNFNVTTEIEWLFNRPLVVICWKRANGGVSATVTEVFIVSVVNYTVWERQTKRYFGEVLYHLKKINTEASQVTWNYASATVFTVSVLAHLTVLLGGFICVFFVCFFIFF